MKEKILLAEMTWPEVKDRLEVSNVALIPVGSTEQHGKHLPFKTDVFIASNIAQRAAEEVFEDVKAVVVPSICYGVSREHMDFPGSITLMPETLKNLVMDICRSLVHHGFKKIVIVNGHGGYGHVPILQVAITDLKEETGAFFALVNYFELVADVMREVAETETQFHADEVETSLALSLGYDADMKKATKCFLKSKSKFWSYDFFSPKRVRIALPSVKDRGTDSGTEGDPTKATKEKGDRILKAAVERLADFLREIKAGD